jgi:hypothetical protein
MRSLSRHGLFFGLIATAVLAPLLSAATMEPQTSQPTSSPTAAVESSSAQATTPVHRGHYQSTKRAIAFVFRGGARNNLSIGADPGFHRIQGTISLSPIAVDTGTSARVTITASGFFDLGEVRESQISIRPSQGVSNIDIAGATAQRLVLTFDLSEDASIGTRTLLIRNNAGATVVALDLVFNRGPHICWPACESPLRCVNNVCVGCRPPCRDDLVCRGNVCVRPPPPVCNPPCREPFFFCNEFGFCETTTPK